MTLRELFDHLHNVGLERSNGVEFLRPPLPLREVRGRLTKMFGKVPEWIVEWFSWHNGSDVEYNGGRLLNRPEHYAFGIDHLAGLDNCAQHHEHHSHFPVWAQARVAVFLLRVVGPDSGHVAVDLGYSECCFLVEGRYTVVLSPSFEDYLALWSRLIAGSVMDAERSWPFHPGVEEDVLTAEGLAVLNHRGEIMWPSSLIPVAFPNAVVPAEREPLDLRLFDIDAIREGFSRASGLSLKPLDVMPWNGVSVTGPTSQTAGDYDPEFPNVKEIDIL